MTHLIDDATELQKHFASTYFGLRMGLVILATLLPLVLLGGGALLHVQSTPLPSLSDYYRSGGPFLRDWFVGTLCTVGVFLYSYKGFTPLENGLLNLAGLGAAFTALVPCACGDSSVKLGWLHNGSAVTFYVAMALVCVLCAGETLTLSDDPAFRLRFERRYRFIGIALALSVVGAFLLSEVLHAGRVLTFMIEASGVFIFAVYWGVKSCEFHQTSAEHLAAAGEAVHVKGVGVVRVPRPPRAAPLLPGSSDLRVH